MSHLLTSHAQGGGANCPLFQLACGTSEGYGFTQALRGERRVWLRLPHPLAAHCREMASSCLVL